MEPAEGREGSGSEKTQGRRQPEKARVRPLGGRHDIPYHCGGPLRSPAIVPDSR